MKATKIEKTFTVTIELSESDADILSDALNRAYAEVKKDCKEKGIDAYGYAQPLREMRNAIAGLIGRCYMGNDM